MFDALRMKLIDFYAFFDNMSSIYVIWELIITTIGLQHIVTTLCTIKFEFA